FPQRKEGSAEFLRMLKTSIDLLHPSYATETGKNCREKRARVIDGRRETACAAGGTSQVLALNIHPNNMSASVEPAAGVQSPSSPSRIESIWDALRTSEH
ncbi:unnamed protein product, partial [Ectocarpus sp. 12 AP-2014]